MKLVPSEFIRRFLLHTLPDGFHRIRHFGFMANGCRARKARPVSVRSSRTDQVRRDHATDEDCGVSSKRQPFPRAPNAAA